MRGIRDEWNDLKGRIGALKLYGLLLFQRDPFGLGRCGGALDLATDFVVGALQPAAPLLDVELRASRQQPVEGPVVPFI